MKKGIITVMTMVMALLVSTMGFAVADNGKGQGNAPDRAEDRGNSLVSESESQEVFTVQPEVGDPTKANFDDQFIYYNVTFEATTFDTWVYREPARLDENVVWDVEDEDGPTTATWSAFWYGVGAPDDGVQSEVVHTDTVWQYFGLEDEWDHLKANFVENDFGHGLLLDVNGVTPAGVFGDVEWSPTSGPNAGDNIESTFSTEQGRVVTTNTTPNPDTSRSVDVTCDRIEGDEAFLYGNDGDDNPVIVYIKGGDSPAFNQWTNPNVTTDSDTCHSWTGDSQFNDGFIVGLDE